MSSEHEKMMSDYLWIRNHSSADTAPQTRTHGYHYLYYHVPNYNERIEMIWRSLGRQYDWELEKFRLSKKPVDQGNKRRIFKNFFRFIKNPGGYFFWKTVRLTEVKGRWMQPALFFLVFGMLWSGKQQSDRNMQMMNTRLRLGENPEGSGVEGFGWNSGQAAYVKIPLQTMFQNDVEAADVMISPAKNQVFRKYFEMRKRKGIAEGEFI